MGINYFEGSIMENNMIYIAKKNGAAVVHADKQAMRDLDGVEPELSMPMAKYLEAGGLARVIDGKIVLGQTEEEKADEEKQKQIAEHIKALEQIDRDSGASRHVRDVSVSAGIVLDAVRVIISRFANELSIQLPSGFGASCQNAADIFALSPLEGATQKEIEDFNVYKSLLLISHFDPAINPGLTILTQAEFAATPIRQALAPLLSGDAG